MAAGSLSVEGLEDYETPRERLTEQLEDDGKTPERESGEVRRLRIVAFAEASGGEVS